MVMVNAIYNIGRVLKLERPMMHKMVMMHDEDDDIVSRTNHPEPTRAPHHPKLKEELLQTHYCIPFAPTF